MLTQLFFEHSLRIRMVAEVSGGSTGKTPKTVTPGGETPSVSGSEGTAVEQAQSSVGEGSSTGHVAEDSNAQTLIASPSVDGKDKPKGEAKEEVKEDNEKANLVGKINNLMSTVSRFVFVFVRLG